MWQLLQQWANYKKRHENPPADLPEFLMLLTDNPGHEDFVKLKAFLKNRPAGPYIDHPWLIQWLGEHRLVINEWYKDKQ